MTWLMLGHLFYIWTQSFDSERILSLSSTNIPPMKIDAYLSSTAFSSWNILSTYSEHIEEHIELPFGHIEHIELTFSVYY